MDDGGVEGRDGVDLLGQLVTKHRELSTERDRVISQVKSLPGFESFLTAPTFTLSTVTSCRLVIINHSRRPSDILILLRDSPHSLFLQVNISMAVRTD